MFITVIICTRNRAESLCRTFDSLIAMRLPENFRWELIVVNNASTDHTGKVIQRYLGRLPIRPLFEPSPGLSLARNRGVEAARGEYVVWADDDVVVAPEWLSAYAAAFSRWPEASFFGGPIVPRYVPHLPKWLIDSEPFLGCWVFARREVDNAGEIPVTGIAPLGPNFALRADEQRAFRYDPELGHAPGRCRRGEETDVIHRIMQAGGKGFWVPDASVEHWSHEDQYSLQYIRSWFASLGEADAVRSSRRPEIIGPSWFGVPRWLWRSLITSSMLYILSRLVSSPSVWMPHFCTQSCAWSAFRYWWNRKSAS